jgi:hypothetical protein
VWDWRERFWTGLRDDHPGPHLVKGEWSMILTLHIAALVVGLYFWYLTFVMRESTEGKWVNRIEEMWIRIDDRSKATRDTAKALFNVVAGKITRIFNGIVGDKVVSIRLVGISGSLSFASACLFSGVTELMMVSGSSLVDKGRINWGSMFLALACVSAALAVLPVIFKSPLWAWISCSPTIFVLLLFVWSIYRKGLKGASSPFLPVPLLSLASDVLFLIIIRQSLRWLSVKTTPLRIMIVLTIQLLLIAIVFLIPWSAPFIELFAIQRRIHSTLLPYGLELSSGLVLFNLPTAVAAISFVFALLIVLLHRVTWPMLSEWTYVLTRNDVLEKRKTVRTIASALILYGLGGILKLAFVLALVERFLK